jgi:hypothetical protein
MIWNIFSIPPPYPKANCPDLQDMYLLFTNFLSSISHFSDALPAKSNKNNLQDWKQPVGIQFCISYWFLLHEIFYVGAKLYFRNCTQGLPLYVHKAELCLAAVC